MRRLFGALGLCLALWGCGDDLKPETVVAGLRVLGIRATPADLAPGQTAFISALVVDPLRPGRRNTVLWIGCDPDPKNLNRSACSDMNALSDPSALVPPAEGEAPTLPPGMRVIGVNERAAYTAPVGLFDALAADDPVRRIGTVAQVLAVAVADEVSPAATPAELAVVFEKMRNKEVASVVAIFRIRVSEDGKPNQNPTVGALVLDGVEQPAGFTLRFLPEAQVPLGLTAADAEFEDYEQVSPAGVEAKTERLIAAWYSTSGRFLEPRVTLRTETAQAFTAPGASGDPVPEQRTGSLWAVVRDTRGGNTWAEWPFFICDPDLPVPALTSLAPTSVSASETVSLSGTNLASVLEVSLGGQVMKGLHSPVKGVFEGQVPALPPGSYPVTLRGKNCGDVETGQSLEIK